jgi:hypothetical protein
MLPSIALQIREKSVAVSAGHRRAISAGLPGSKKPSGVVQRWTNRADLNAACKRYFVCRPSGPNLRCWEIDSSRCRASVLNSPPQNSSISWNPGDPHNWAICAAQDDAAFSSAASADGALSRCSRLSLLRVALLFRRGSPPHSRENLICEIRNRIRIFRCCAGSLPSTIK